ncbi:hypothetical protein IV417_02950 [Alphaproteobacteria bacterium KMM 3653]|uniref:Uncharacterized protein n=1 Tax=Harenicola maris TaxID=2841044 RepID=A0AAP2CKY7_9RHOB|nr:hypothetical protein [Harenicola maris]
MPRKTTRIAAATLIALLTAPTAQAALSKSECAALTDYFTAVGENLKHQSQMSKASYSLALTAMPMAMTDPTLKRRIDTLNDDTKKLSKSLKEMTARSMPLIDLMQAHCR